MDSLIAHDPLRGEVYAERGLKAMGSGEGAMCSKVFYDRIVLAWSNLNWREALDLVVEFLELKRVFYMGHGESRGIRISVSA